jgi:hypothetical protein
MPSTTWTNTDGGDWNTAGNWSAGVPDSSTDAVFDAASFNADGKTITFSALAVCHDIITTAVDQTFTIQSSVYSLEVYGSTTLTDKLTVTFTGTAYWKNKSTGAETITQGSATWRPNIMYFDGSGGSWTLQDTINIGDTATYIFVYNGTFDSNNQTITTYSFRTYAGTKTITLGSSTVNIKHAEFGNNTTNLTFNCGTSTLSGVIGTLTGGGLTYYDVTTSTASSLSITGANTFNNLTYNGLNQLGCDIYFDSNNTVSGTFTINGASRRYAMAIRSNTLGTQRTITSASNSFTHVDIRDIKGAGAGSWDFSGSEIGDCGGNTDITFRAGESRYYYQNTGNFHDAKWYDTTGGGGSAVGMPLPQDTAVFDADSFSGSATLTIANARIGSIDMSAVDEAVTLTLSNAIECYGHHVLGSNITPSGNYGRSLIGVGNYNLNIYSKTLYSLLIYRGNWTFISNATFSAGIYPYGNSTTNPSLDLNDYNITAYEVVTFSGTYYLDFYLGNGTLELTDNSASNVWDVYANIHIFAESSTIKLNPTSGSNTITFSGYNKTYNNIWFSGSHTGSFNITGANTFNNIKIDAGKTLKFTAGTTTNFASLTAWGASGSLITITSITGATHTLNYTGTAPIECQYLDISYSTVNQVAKLYAGATSTNSGNNTNWIFGNFLTPIVNFT